MAHPLPLTPQLQQERAEPVVCRSLSKAHRLLGARESELDRLRLGHTHPIDEATVAPSVRALRDPR